jgi:hypothetical protein
MMRDCRIAAIAALSSLLAVTPAAACTEICIDAPSSPKRSFQSADVVVIATVESVDLGKSAAVHVDELYKGKTSAVITVDSGFGSDCRMYLEAGKQYLLFLYRRKGVAALVPEYNCEPSGEVGSKHVADALAWVRRQKKRQTSDQKG